jgi:capsular polysaccharide biosynthesis protein
MRSRWLLVLLGTLVACMVSTGAAFVADHFDPSLRTADEVMQVLRIPILAAVPKRNAG